MWSSPASSWPSFEASAVDTRRLTLPWLLAAATYGVGDVVTTIALVWFDPLHIEANPFVYAAIDSLEQVGLVGLKLGVFGFCFALSLWAATDEEDVIALYGPPAILTIIGLTTTAHNLNLLFGALPT
ncbi:hypothetical protein VB773_10205 [Haloarculaceae archaeon H-GB2-1]|nr:hypothetical protein [Haloarculaceae archaeon H-GB1-1]MEA5386386.1 hypothetical protein [Haloarculaceae archaeon H-GB11]MEA5407894.1 hypothetical protein [Haloarculaceae archaeon H-GB2-1]